MRKNFNNLKIYSFMALRVKAADDSSLFLQVYGCLTSFVVLFGFLNTAKGIALRTDKAVCQETAWRDGIKLDGWLLVWLVLVL